MDANGFHEVMLLSGFEANTSRNCEFFLIIVAIGGTFWYCAATPLSGVRGREHKRKHEQGDIYMAFCGNCGAQIGDGATICAACSGRVVAVPAPAMAGPGLADNVAGMLAYITIIPAIIFLLIEPYNRSRFIRFHSWQCIFFNIGWWILWIGLHIVAHIPFLGWLTILVWPLVGLGGFILWLVLLIKANQGQMFKLPVIGPL
jgi:uncharacterized membrane protein